MDLKSSKIGITNSLKSPLGVYVEPWGEDFTLMPGEELFILAYGGWGVPWFHLVESDGVIQVHCEETSNFKVVQGEQELQCGHQRQE